MIGLARLPLLDAWDGPFALWLGDPAPWAAWRTFIKVLSAEPLEDPDEWRLFEECTGRTTPPAEPPTEAWCIVGRRGRKSAVAAVLAVYQSVHRRWPRAPGETLRTIVVANTKDQAALVKSYAEAILRSRPGFTRLIVGVDGDTIALRNNVEIKCVANSFRSIRGPTVVCAIFEELAFWRDETSANPDMEILRAVKPSMLTAKGAVLIGISSPYAKRGLLWEKHRDHFGDNSSRALVWQAPTTLMNPEVDRGEIERAYEEDPEAAAAEYGAQFRDDLSSFLDAELLEPLVRRSPLELPRLPGVRYQPFVDPSGGRGDAFTLAIGHWDGRGVGVIDLVRAVAPPFDPAVVVRQYAAVLKAYGLSMVTGDAYSGAWVETAFQDEGIAYRVSDKPKSALYLESLPVFMRGDVELPDDRRLLVELANLERRTARGGRDSVDHPRGGRDDRANVVCGVLVQLAMARQPIPLIW
jgi:hypothetical protein